MENFCKNCGAHIKEDTKFCQECGTEIKNTKVKNTCPKCGEKLDENIQFCPECGTSLNTPKIVKKTNFIDNNKLPIIIIATVVIIAVIIGATLMLTAKPADVGTQTVSVGTNMFEIPGDYRVDPSTIDVDYTGYSAVFSQGYSNGEELIYITVMTIPYGVDGEQVASSQGGTHKTLMGVSGYYIADEDGLYTFAFVDGTYLNVVTVSSPYVLDEITYRG